MKRKLVTVRRTLITGLGLALVVFIAGALVVIKNLDDIVENQELVNEHGFIIEKYNEMLFQMQGAQKEIYRHQAGYTRNVDDLVNHIETFEERMSLISARYEAHINDAACMKCHHRIDEKLTSINGMFLELRRLLRGYKEDVSILITTSDAEQMRTLEHSAARTGEDITALLEKVRHAEDKMLIEIKKNRNIIIRKSRVTIIVAILLSIIMVSVIFFIVFRGVTGPVASLIKGIRAVAGGDFSGRVRVESKNEIGSIADAFNEMAERLQTMNLEKDDLLRALRGGSMKNLKERCLRPRRALRPPRTIW
jgi:two-component system NtrC family sensor kinase